MEYIVVSVLNGVVHGLLLFMVSAGLTLIFGMMGVLNFAHAWFYMLGAYVGFTLTRLGGFWIGLALAPIVAGLAGVLVERYMLRRVHKYGHAHELLLTFGLAFIIEEVIKLFYGDALVSYQMPNYMRFAAFTIFETNYPFYRLFMGAVALAMFAVLYLLLTRTRVGIVVRAATYRPTTVEALGHNLPLVYMARVRRRLRPGRACRRRGRRLLSRPAPTWRSTSERSFSSSSSSAGSAPSSVPSSRR